MTHGKNINLFLMDGDGNGRIKCTLANWTGVAYKIPRTMIEKAKEIRYLNQTGVYLLFGSSDDTGDDVVYVGQAGIRKNGQGILCRLDEHRRNEEKDYWTEAVAFTTSNNSFGPTEISYLENRFCSMARKANRYIVKNSNDPNHGNITEEKESELEEFIVYAKLVMGALGYKVFEPLVKTGEDSIEVSNVIEQEPLLYINTNQVQATGQRSNEGFIVFKGSRMSPTTTPSCAMYTKKKREKEAKKISPQYITTEDILFKSPSGAASFLRGGNTNGYEYWKDVAGRTLKEIEQR